MKIPAKAGQNTTMNVYQQKWLTVLHHASLPGWKIEARGDDIFIEMPHVTDLKLIRDNLPETLALMSLDITGPKERLKFIIHNGYEQFDYLLNPGDADLNKT
ncbi:hypothetical protein [Mucilaginibacter ginsenosidivorax]|uniref:Uncharacterized protein n=1 Tax=Mucilaginibacter ginsenosidivorax TaxID=862126 RepID=A0A5B8VV25_9SPHI|nr:hypothetical protein [Mucilaginibacter ginsenosidivorax]QEC75427.1 hypothetical protein FSB76_05510 [Mucilaginibacter ginsenosidivorax]